MLNDSGPDPSEVPAPPSGAPLVLAMFAASALLAVACTAGTATAVWAALDHGPYRYAVAMPTHEHRPLRD